MKPLATEFDDTHFHYRQIERAGDIAIYCQEHKIGGATHYEVARVRSRPAYTWPDGTTTAAHEYYPGSNAWGRDGWTCFTLAAARTLAAALGVPL